MNFIKHSLTRRTALSSMLIMFWLLGSVTITMSQEPWTTKTDMLTARWGLSASAVDGKIYAIEGTKGFNQPALSTVEEYDPTVLPVSLPEFTKIDTGAIYSSTGHHVASGWFDMDNDNDMDVIITNSSGMGYTNHPNLLYKNELNGYFTRITETELTQQNLYVGLPGPFGDIDNDGDQDLINANWLGGKSYLYFNDGHGNFEYINDINQLSGATSVLFDLDNDSYLDIVQFHEDSSMVYYNDGTGNFDNYENLNISCQDPLPVLHNLALGDADNDGDFDLYMGYTNVFGTSSYKAKNEFFLNNGSGSFERQSDTATIVKDPAQTPSINWIDYDNDGDMDLYVLNSFSPEPVNSVSGALFENKGGLKFEKHIIEPVDYRDAHRVSSVWGDLDNDADLDLYITIEKNGFAGHTSPVKHNLLMQNNGDGSFSEISGGTLAEESSHTATFEDFDNDGDLDVLLVRFSWASNGYNTLCMNEGNDNSWLILTLKGTGSNSTAFGAHIIAKATINGQQVMQTREITPMSGHATYNSTRVHFGLGDADQVDTLIIRWPSGQVDALINIETNHFITVEEGKAPVSVNNINKQLLEVFKLNQNYPNPFNPVTTIEYTVKEPCKVRLIVMNMVGQVVKELIHSYQQPGVYSINLNMQENPSGIYFYKIRMGNYQAVRKMVKIE